MIQVMWDSFCRMIIRFFDNQFVREENPEILRLHRLIDKILNERALKPIAAEVEVSGESTQIGNPIETPFARRARLENESRIEWVKQLETAKSKLTTKQLEKLTGVVQ